jgi:dsDNA-specific endonuclease/ATPase MutS2
LFEHINTLQQVNLATFQYTLVQDFAEKAIEKPKFSLSTVVPHTPKKVKSVQDIPKYELDLHIEHLIDNYKGLNNAEMLQIQLNFLERYLTVAFRNKQDKMVIIHGVGKGVLRTEVIKILKANQFVEKTESGWQAGYGFGATIAYFKY